MNMPWPPISLLPIFVFFLLTMHPTNALDPVPMASSLPEVANSFPSQALWPHQPRAVITTHHRHLSKQDRAHHGMPSRARGPGDGSLRLLSRSVLGEELGLMHQPAALRQKDVFLGFEFQYPEQQNLAPGLERGKKQNREHHRHSRRERLKQHQGI